MPAESKKFDTKCLEPFGGKSGGWVLLQLIVEWDVQYPKLQSSYKKKSWTILKKYFIDSEIVENLNMSQYILSISKDHIFIIYLKITDSLIICTLP